MLRQTIILLGLAVVIGGCKKGDQLPQWEEFHSQEFGFKVKFPGKPSTKKGEGLGQIGSKTIAKPTTIFVVEVSDKAFMVIASTTTESVGVNNRELPRLLEEFRDRAVTNSNSKLESSKRVMLQGTLQGLDVVTRPTKETLANGLVRLRFFLIDKTEYGVGAAGPGNFVNEEQATEFIDSFRLD